MAIFRLPKRPDWRFRLHHLVMHQMDDGDTLVAPHEEARAEAKRLIHRHRPELLAFVRTSEEEAPPLQLEVG